MRSGRRARAAGAAGALLGLAPASSADQIATAPARQFQLVEERFESSKLQHARVVRAFMTRGDRISSTTFGISAGARAMGLSELGRELESNGYPSIGTRPTYGVGAGLFGSRVFGALTFEGAGQTIRSTSGIEGRLGYFDFVLQGGPVFTVQRAALVYPYAGIGVSQVSIRAETADPLATPILRGSLPSLPKGFDVFSTFGTLEFGIGSLVSLPIADEPADCYGIAVGTELGYSFPFAESKWRDTNEGPNPPSYAGPSGGVHGPLVRLLIRYVYDGFQTTYDERVLESCHGGGCKVVCDDGFADCDADPRNGCETELGTLDDCGGCGDACTVRHGTGVCAPTSPRARRLAEHLTGDDEPAAPVDAVEGYQCVAAACDPGFMNCNGWSSDGCETPTAIDPYNCGVCGGLCTPLEHCFSGKCLPKSETDGIR